MVVENMVSDSYDCEGWCKCSLHRGSIFLPLVIRHCPRKWRCGEKTLPTLKQIWTFWSKVRCKITYSWWRTLSGIEISKYLEFSARVNFLIIQWYEPQNPSSHAREASNPSRTPDEIHTFAIITPKKPTPYLFKPWKSYAVIHWPRSCRSPSWRRAHKFQNDMSITNMCLALPLLSQNPNHPFNQSTFVPKTGSS